MSVNPSIPTIKVNVETYDEFVGSNDDWAEIAVTDELKEKVRDLQAFVGLAGADFIEKFDDTPEFHLEEGTETESNRLVVTPGGEFWWAGMYWGRGKICWETPRLTLKDLDISESLDRRYSVRASEEEESNG